MVDVVHLEVVVEELGGGVDDALVVEREAAQLAQGLLDLADWLRTFHQPVGRLRDEPDGDPADRREKDSLEQRVLVLRDVVRVVPCGGEQDAQGPDDDADRCEELVQAREQAPLPDRRDLADVHGAGDGGEPDAHAVEHPCHKNHLPRRSK